MFNVSNRLKTSLAKNAASGDTTLLVFPPKEHWPNLLDGEFFPLTLKTQAADDYEIVWVLKVADDQKTLTVQRGKEGTVAKDFMTGDIASINTTAGMLNGAAEYGYMKPFDPAVIGRDVPNYPKGSLVLDKSKSFFWFCVADNGSTTVPGTNGDWTKFVPSVPTPPPPVVAGADIGDVKHSYGRPSSGWIRYYAGSQVDSGAYPDLASVLPNGRMPGQTADDFFRNAGTLGSGQTFQDAIVNITGRFGADGWTNGNDVAGWADGAFTVHAHTYAGIHQGKDDNGFTEYNFAASNVVRTAPEVRPNCTAIPVWIYAGQPKNRSAFLSFMSNVHSDVVWYYCSDGEHPKVVFNFQPQYGVSNPPWVTTKAPMLDGKSFPATKEGNSPLVGGEPVWEKIVWSDERHDWVASSNKGVAK